MYVDLGAEELLAAEKGGRQIAIEVKSFVSASAMADLENALGQYIVYHDVLAEIEPDRTLYLAVPQRVLLDIFEEPLGELLLRNNRARLIGFDPDMEVIVQWIP